VTHDKRGKAIVLLHFAIPLCHKPAGICPAQLRSTEGRDADELSCTSSCRCTCTLTEQLTEQSGARISKVKINSDREKSIPGINLPASPLARPTGGRTGGS